MSSFFELVKTSYADIPVSSDNNAIAVEPFLAATEDLTKLFDFINATAFSPVKSDMLGNVKKIRERYQTNPTLYTSLQSIVQDESKNSAGTGKKTGTEGLLWLRRGLEFTSMALRRNLNDPKEELQVSFTKAYEQTLQKHHNMFVKPIFHAVPYRADFYKKIGGVDEKETMQKLEIWLSALEKNVKILADFYAVNKYE